jgi:hypothetical protein
MHPVIRAARFSTLAVAAWLFVSPLVWSHGTAEACSACVTGALAAIVACGALAFPPMRFANLTPAAWLAISPWVLQMRAGPTKWNALAAAVALVVAMIPNEPYVAEEEELEVDADA